MAGLPKVSFVVCTFNCRDYAERCFESIRKQNYPQNKVEIVVVDSYSTDGTIEIAKKFKANLILTKIRGYMEGKGMPKSMGCEKAKGDIIFTLDSDNSLVEKNWIRNMIYPLITNNKIDYCICRMKVIKSDSLTNQYLSLVGTDPFAIYSSFDPRISMHLISLEDKGKYVIYNNKADNFLITGGYYLGFRKETLKNLGGYSRDVDVAYSLAEKEGGALIAIPKETHVHHLITTSLFDFIKKKRKWGKYYFTSGNAERKFEWTNGAGKKARFVWEVIKNLTFVLPFLFSLYLTVRDRQPVWLLHAPVKWLTTAAYIFAFLEVKLGKK